MPRYVHPTVQSYRESGKPMVERRLIWVTARDYSTGNPVTGGFWDGRYDMELSVLHPETGAAVSRVYHAGGSLLEIEALGHFSGLDIHPLRVTLSPINTAVEGLLRGYDLRGAPVELHRAWFDYQTRQPLAPAHVWMTGTINRAPLTTAEAGGRARLVYTIVPQTRALTVGNPEILSDTIQSQRSGDRFLRHIATAGTREIPWMRT